MSMIALSGTRTRSVNVAPSGLARACTVTSRGMSWADTRATPASTITTARAALDAARETGMGYYRVPGQSTPWCGFVTGASPLDELLQPLSFPGFRGVQVALRIDGDAVHAVELARLPPPVTERRQLLERLPIDDPDAI